jgi:hypothetical protein
MALLGERSASFIVRIWRESGTDERSVAEWRGYIEHVGSLDKLFFRDLDAVRDFLKQHLADIGIDVDQRFWEVIDTTADPDDSPAIPSGERRGKPRARR